MAVDVSGWCDFFTQISSFIDSLERQYGLANLSFTEYAVMRIFTTVRSLRHIESTLISSSDSNELQSTIDDVTELLDIVVMLQTVWKQYKEALENSPNMYRLPPTVRGSGRGRPRFDVTQEQLEYLRSLSFNWASISSILGVSRMTVYRRRREYGMCSVIRSMTDSELDACLHGMRRDLPYSGETVIMGRLRSMNFCIPRRRIRESLQRIDPINTPLRWGRNCHSRRPYSVPGPNCLWHIDGHHKLIRWGLVTHGGIDGYSRLIVFLKCSTNNKSATVYQLFLSAVDKHGLPSRIRTDCGMENFEVARHMLRHRGIGRGSIITGSSPHNQRIERLWRDVHGAITKLYYRLFYHLEQCELLDPLNDLHLFCLQYVYQPRLNRALEIFRCAWNHHGIRTMHNATPHQLFAEGAIRMQMSGLDAIDFFSDIDSSEYGVEDVEDINYDSDMQGVPVPETDAHNRYSPFIDILNDQVNPLAESDNFAIEIYQRVLLLMERNLHVV